MRDTFATKLVEAVFDEQPAAKGNRFCIKVGLPRATENNVLRQTPIEAGQKKKLAEFNKMFVEIFGELPNFYNTPHRWRELRTQAIAGVIPMESVPSLESMLKDDLHALNLRKDRLRYISQQAGAIVADIYEAAAKVVPEMLEASKKADAKRQSDYGSDSGPSIETRILSQAAENFLMRAEKLRGPSMTAPSSMIPFLFPENK